jgi:hypothetical protein
MSIASIKKKHPSGKLPDLDRQIAQAKTVLRELRDTLEDMDDRRDLARARKKNGGKAGSSWEAVKKELGIEV